MKTIKGEQILVVDDEPIVCKSIKMLLTFDGHSVQTVESGEAALALLEHTHFDLIITDYSMAGMKGDQLAERIKRHRPDQSIIMASAFADEFKGPGKLSVAVDFLLTKPFSLTELRDAVALALG
jgi:CheY-like chemotaxis protein